MKKDDIIKVIKNYGSFILLVIIIFCFLNLFNKGIETASFSKIPEVSYQEFLDLIKENKIDTVYYNNNDEYMTFTLINNATKGLKNFITKHL